MVLSLQERLAIYFERLKAAPPATSAQEAIELINKTLDEVEDEYSGIPKNPNPSLKFDGRMYPVQSDFIRPNPNDEDGYILRTRGHEIYVYKDGRILIIVRPDRPNGGQVILEKLGGGVT
jgi:hypothetical protein